MLASIYSQTPALLIIFSYLGCLLILAELLNRHLKTDAELTRKIVHIGSGNVILLAWWLNITADIILLAALVASTIAVMSYYVPILPSVNSVGRRSLGTLFYAISIGILTLLFWREDTKLFTILGILIMSYGDGLAALIGQKWGRHPYILWGNKKSWEGSLTMFFVSMIITLLLLPLTGDGWYNYPLISATVAITATFLEIFSFIGIDNLTVPVFTSVLAYCLQQLAQPL
ncbi:MAG: SEC59/DGK1/VTE5 family protein [Geminocystis sp.]|nr:SEC59/DGK1/VTE5 family protein [Geminocystis sp.]HIK37714.1 phosphatidate cytidylyltransferase [Geminocystis sp. M7585_C2015_104]MCS7147254.1 SEC59/DGK1/VTE5 family protein [Geminocystis sp.]MCX8078520.1 SEC59/DGK1/VTE5 family protein [Geminocystis sp.]MDW8116251.1 SEC59/DGK1/VTE5 family protein [Geminocystis sp.]